MQTAGLGPRAGIGPVWAGDAGRDGNTWASRGRELCCVMSFIVGPGKSSFLELKMARSKDCVIDACKPLSYCLTELGNAVDCC